MPLLVITLLGATVIAVLALALYVTGAVLDQVPMPNGLTRVALFPPWQAVVSFAAAAVLLVWSVRALDTRTGDSTRRPSATLLWPLLSASLLLVPYLPVLPDVLPATQMLAGPLRFVVWLVVAAQVCWVWWPRVSWPSRWSLPNDRWFAGALIVATCVLAGAAAARLTGTVLYPGGDEPHYLVIAQSLWRDGDLAIENNHTRGDYYEYFARALDPHYLTRGADQRIYSIHPIGMPVLIAPVYAIGGYRLVVAVFVFMAAVAGAVMWRVAAQAIGDRGAAMFAWAAVVITAPFFFNVFAVYPEIPAALVVAFAFSRLLAEATSHAHLLTIGALCAVLPWLSTKYAPMSAALMVVGALRLWWPRVRERPRSVGTPLLRSLLTLGLPYALSLAAWFYFFYAIWGVPLPQAPYGTLVQTDLQNLLFGAPGLLFDQEYGLLPYAPVYVLAASGLFAMWRSGGETRRRAVEIAVIFAALLATVGAFRIWWGGSASPGRPLTSGVLLLMLPIASAFRAQRAGSTIRATHHVLLWTSIGLTGVLLFAQGGALTANGRDGTSSLLEHISPRWPAWTLAPSFIYHEAGMAWLHTAAWLVLAAGAALLLRRLPSASLGVSSLAAVAVLALTLTLASVVMPLLPLVPAWPSLDVRARARAPLLDSYDAGARPIAVEYAPLFRSTPAAVLSRASLEVSPLRRSDPQPLRVLHNGRFSLPAGRYRIEVHWNGVRSVDTLSLQVGRVGEPFLQWPVEARPGEIWQTEIDLPVDAPFVGLRGSQALERVISRIRFVPLAVVDAAARPRVPAVLGAARAGAVSIFYSDEHVSAEPTGFWILGGHTATVSLQGPPGVRTLRLRVHSGPIHNRLHGVATGWSQSVALTPQVREEIEVPTADNGFVTLALHTDHAFVPHALDPASTDTRALGAWVEVVPLPHAAGH